MTAKRGGVPPYGYQRTPAGDIVQSPQEQAIIAEIVERYNAGETNAGIAMDLQNRGVLTRRNGRWSGTAIREIIRWRDLHIKRYG